MKTSVKILSFLLAAALTLPLFASCSDGDMTMDDTQGSTTVGTESTDALTAGSPITSEAPATTEAQTVETPETTETPVTTDAQTTESTSEPAESTDETTATVDASATETSVTTEPAPATTTTAPVTTTTPATTTTAPVMTPTPTTTTTKAPVTTTTPTTTTTKAPVTTTTPATTTTPKQPEPVVPTPAEKAEEYTQVLNTLMRKINTDYYVKINHYLRGEPGSGSSAYVWAFASYLEALSDWYSINPEAARSAYVEALDNGLPRYRVTVNSLSTPAGTFRNIVYYNAGAGGRGDYYYDDNAWVCYQLLNAYVLLGDKKYLTEAENLLAFFKTGWDDKFGGGIYWNKDFVSKNTCADGPIAICFLWAYQLTEKADYLEWGTKVFKWMDSTLREGDLYSDNIGGGGAYWWKADYNQGTPIYAACLLYEITGDKTYLNRARDTANAALGLAFNGSGANVSLNGNPIYKSWCVGWLMRGFEKYVEVSGRTGNFFTYMETVLDRTLAKPDSNGYYDPYFGVNDWLGESRTDVLQRCGVACVIAICARHERWLASQEA